MGKALYFFRTLIVSVEAFILLAALLAHQCFGAEINNAILKLSIDAEFSKLLMALPFGLAIWILSELRKLVFENAVATTILLQWPDYWRLKTHIWCSVIFAAVFVCISIVPWLLKAGISDGVGLTILLTSILGQLTVAGSIYFASFRIREVLAAEGAS